MPNVPAGQSAQLDESFAPSTRLNFPASHSAQLVEPTVGANVPGRQGKLRELRQYVPLGHGWSHVDEALEEANQPGAHGSGEHACGVVDAGSE